MTKPPDSSHALHSASADLWQAGWLGIAAHRPSPHFGPRPAGVMLDLLVIHSISLPPGQYGGPEIVHLFMNQLNWEAHPYFQSIRGMQVSSHFLIRRDGQLIQFVSCDDRAWHAGVSSFQGRHQCNDFSIGIELEGLEGDIFEPAQYLQLAKLCQTLRQQYPISAVVGHEHVAPGRKFDPGAGFDWPSFIKTVDWPHHYFPALSISKL